MEYAYKYYLYSAWFLGSLQSLDWTGLDYWTPSKIECLALYQYSGTYLCKYINIFNGIMLWSVTNLFTLFSIHTECYVKTNDQLKQ